MALADFLFGKNPADVAAKSLEKIPGAAHEAYDPYIQRGLEAGGTLSNKFGAMSQDPAAFIESLMQSYQPSRSYQLKNDEMQRASGNTAAAGGLRGGQLDINNSQHIADTLMGEDMQQWLQNVLGVNQQGLAGEQGLYGTGAQASGALGSDLSNLYGTQAQLAFQGQAQQNQRRSDMLTAGAKGLGALALAPLTGGASLFSMMPGLMSAMPQGGSTYNSNRYI